MWSILELLKITTSFSYHPKISENLLWILRALDEMGMVQSGGQSLGLEPLPSSQGIFSSPVVW